MDFTLIHTNKKGPHKSIWIQKTVYAGNTISITSNSNKFQKFYSNYKTVTCKRWIENERFFKWYLQMSRTNMARARHNILFHSFYPIDGETPVVTDTINHYQWLVLELKRLSSFSKLIRIYNCFIFWLQPFEVKLRDKFSSLQIYLFTLAEFES